MSKICPFTFHFCFIFKPECCFPKVRVNKQALNSVINYLVLEIWNLENTHGKKYVLKTCSLEMILCFQKYGLKVYLRDPSSYTPILEPGGKDGTARSLTIYRDKRKTASQIAQFSTKDAQV